MVHTTWSLLGAAAVALLIVIIRGAFTVGHRNKDMPSGPRTLPFIGNVHQIPKRYSHLQFTAWSKLYGGLYTLKIGPATLAVVTDRRIVKEHLDRKSAAYAHRPESHVAQDLMTRNDHLLVMHYGDRWRNLRRLIHQHFNEAAVERRQVEIVEAEATQLVRDHILDPENHMLHPKRYSNSISNSIIYGIRTSSIRSENMRRLYKLMSEWSEILETGATPPVDVFPWLRWIPERFLGLYVTRARSIGAQMDALYAEVLAEVEARRERGINLGTFMDAILDAQRDDDGSSSKGRDGETNGSGGSRGAASLSRHETGALGGVLMEGGSDTTSSLILTIVQGLLVAEPGVQRRAHEEIDAAVGHARSPTWEDLRTGKLPYVNMIVKEAHRWRPITPLGVPHALGEDDWIDGKLLPKGTIVVVNVWGMHMDPPKSQGEYDPSKFIPERYARHPLLAPEYVPGKHDERDHYGYGFGRRICPGIHLAERNLLLAVAKLLWAFRFEKGEGKEVNCDPIEGYHHGIIYSPKNYACKPVLRSEEIRDTVEREFEKANVEVFSRFSVG